MSNLFDAEHKKETCKILCIGISSVVLLGLALIVTISLISKDNQNSSPEDSSSTKGDVVFPTDDKPFLPPPPTENLYYVHLIPHSHQDASWLDNVDANFKVATKIFNGVTKSLIENPERKFSVADMMFFKKWYVLQDQETKDQWKQFIVNRQIEFINGGWVSTDEATPTYDQLLENMHMGHEFLWEEFKYVPQYAWEVDTFGHSSMNAQLFAQMGFKAMFYWRQDYKDRDSRSKNGEMEYIWEPFFEQADPDEIQEHKESMFIHLFHGGYQPPDFIRVQNPYHKIKFTEKDMPNLFKRLSKHLEDRRKGYKTHHLLIPMGDDFAYSDAPSQFHFMDMLIAQFEKKLNSQELGEPFNRFKLLYSSIDQYYNSVQYEAELNGITFDVAHGDFEPLISDSDKIWNGYYTSRPLFKALIKSLTNIAQSSSTLYSYAMMAQLQDHQEMDQEWQAELQEMSQSLLETQSLMMHHDTITGTSKERVIKWDRQKIWEFLQKNEEIMAEVLMEMTQLKNEGSLQEELDIKSLTACYLDLKNEENYLDQCNFINLENATLLVVYNPSLENVRMPSLEFFKDNLDISEWNFRQQQFQKLQIEALEFERGFEGRKFEVFLNSIIPPESLALYYIQPCEEGHSIAIEPEISVRTGQINNDQVHLTLTKFNGEVGEGAAVFVFKDFQSKLEQEFVFDFREYKDYRSGTYTFKTNDKDSKPYQHTISEVKIFHGAIVKQIQLIYNPSKDPIPSLVRINLYMKGPLMNQVEFDVFAGKIDKVEKGKELTVNWKPSNFDSRNQFLSDGNELGILRRYVHKQDTVSLHFYPVDSFIMVEDEGKNVQMAVMNSLSEAGSAYSQSRVELIINRRTTTDDNLGMQESLRESYSFMTKYYLQFSKDREEAFENIRHRQHMIDHHPITYFTYDFLNKDIVESQAPETQLQSYMEIQEIENIFIYPKPSLDTFVVRVTLSKEGVHLKADDLAYKVLTNAFKKLSFQHGDMDFDYSGKINVKQLAMDEVRELDPDIDKNYLQRKDYIIQVFEIELENKAVKTEKFLALNLE